MLEALGQDYVRTARAKGLPDRLVWLCHALRNALLPFVTLSGRAFPFLLTGAVLVATVFAWRGMGRLAAEAIFRRDYPVVTAAAMLASGMVVLGSLLADLLYAAADPRIRTSDACTCGPGSPCSTRSPWPSRRRARDGGTATVAIAGDNLSLRGP